MLTACNRNDIGCARESQCSLHALQCTEEIKHDCGLLVTLRSCHGHKCQFNVKECACPAHHVAALPMCSTRRPSARDPAPSSGGGEASKCARAIRLPRPYCQRMTAQVGDGRLVEPANVEAVPHAPCICSILTMTSHIKCVVVKRKALAS